MAKKKKLREFPMRVDKNRDKETKFRKVLEDMIKAKRITNGEIIKRSKKL